jgi:hypothetical protein
MTGLPPVVVQAVIVAAMLASMARAFFGPAPRETDGFAALSWMVAGIALFAAALWAGGDASMRAVLAAVGVEATCVAGWWLRRRDDGGEVEPAPDPPQPLLDWDAFDRARSAWRPRERV